MGEGAIASFPDEVLEYVLKFLASNKDRNAVSLVCKAWLRAEGFSRESVFVGNCYAVSPEILIRRFPRAKSLTLKGKPRFADFGFLPPGWGAYPSPWLVAMAASHPWLEELRLKRMHISDDCLSLIASSFPNFKSLVLTNCEGFSTHGLAIIASRCRQIRDLVLHECDIEDRGVEWISCFPESCTSLASLNFACVVNKVDFTSLESLVARCPKLQSLRLNKEVSLPEMQRLLVRAPQLVDLGTGSYSQQMKFQQFRDLQMALNNCSNLRTLSGFWDISPVLLRSLYFLCKSLSFLNLSYVTISSKDFCNLISHCSKLQRLWVQDNVEDKGLEQVGETCRDLRELRVFPQDHLGDGCVTDAGLLAVSRGCPKLTYVLYFCKHCTNAGITQVSQNCRELTQFRLCIITPQKTDPATGEPMDEAFGAVVKNCGKLKRLGVSGLLTDRAFEMIGKYGKRLETLSVAFAGESDLGMQHILQGCTSLRKLEIRDSPFGDEALISGMSRLESMRFLWMSACNVTIGGSSTLARANPRLNVEVVFDEAYCYQEFVGRLYVYRSLVGPRQDSNRVITL